MRSILVILPTLALGACASGPAERNLALATSRQLELHQEQVKQFIARQSDVNAANARELNEFALDTLRIRGDIDRQNRVWVLVGKQQLVTTLGQLTGVSAADIVASLATTGNTAAALSDSDSGAALDGADKNLKALASAKSGGWTGIMELAAYLGSVNAAVGALQTSTATATPTPKPSATP